MTTTIKGRGHDVARALSGFVCFPPPTPIHPSTRYLFLCFSHFMHRDYCVVVFVIAVDVVVDVVDVFAIVLVVDVVVFV